nr:radical SAM protein [Lachnospiraceae bacterium]
MRLYIHIPFCVKKCDYCDFLSYAGMGEKVSLYLTALKKDIIHTAEELYLRERKKAGVSGAAAADGVNAHPKLSLDSVYIGGGTPGYLPADAIASVMDTVKEHFDIATNAEITIETNPCTVTGEKASAYLKAGINRVSMGVQSFNDEVLKTLGRAHNAETAIKA